MLKWEWENTPKPPSRICTYAATGGHLEILKWLRARNYVMDESVCTWAATGGHLEVIRTQKKKTKTHEASSGCI